MQVTDRYGTAQTMAWDRIHPRLTTRSAWIDHDGELPLIEGTPIRLEVDHLPGGGEPLPLWLWSSKTGMSGEGVDLRRQAFLRRFDLEHTFRMIEQTLGWTRPKTRTPEAADCWTWLIITGPASPLGATSGAWPAHPGPGPPWVPEHPRSIAMPGPCTETQPTGPRPPPRVKEPATATRYDVGKTVRRPETITERNQTRP